MDVPISLAIGFGMLIVIAVLFLLTLGAAGSDEPSETADSAIPETAPDPAARRASTPAVHEAVPVRESSRRSRSRPRAPIA